MKSRYYKIEMLGVEIKVVECDKQKQILDILDEMLDIAQEFNNWSYTFEDDAFFIEYNDGTTYVAMESMEEGIYKKKNIKSIHYINDSCDMVYGSKYEINEYGCVSVA